jgi:error-prone DNA polymerase
VGTQLSLPLEVPAPPALREQAPWERLVADYASIGMTLADHPMALLREDLDERVVTSEGVGRLRDGARVEVAGIVVARQRPATARGVTFMLLEDERGCTNLVVPPPVYERHRLAVRTAPFIKATGRVERREGVQNVVASSLEPLSRPDLPAADVRQIDSPAERQTDRQVADLGAVLPAAHSFGRRGR